MLQQFSRNVCKLGGQVVLVGHESCTDNNNLLVDRIFKAARRRLLGVAMVCGEVWGEGCAGSRQRQRSVVEEGVGLATPVLGRGGREMMGRRTRARHDFHPLALEDPKRHGDGWQ